MDTSAPRPHPFLVPPGVSEHFTAAEAAITNELLHELFEAQAKQRPDQLAVICGHQRITYGELEAQANRLARRIAGNGIGKGDCVGLLLLRSIDLYAALLAVLKCGAAYVPLDPDYPPDRVGFILSDCNARALLTTSSLAVKAVEFTGQIICLESEGKESSEQCFATPNDAAAPRLQEPVTANDLCYIIYTSGSTGRPKGVQIEHRSACHLVKAEAEIFRVKPSDKVYQGFSIAFDASVEEIWLAFFAGATLVAATAEVVHAGPALPRMLTAAGVTVLSCVPTLLAMFEEDLPSVRLLILGGEACPPELAKRWRKPGRRVINTYGPTEATVVATWCECQPDKPVTIGRPLPGYSAFILNENLQPVRDANPGELCLGGIGLARGYVGRPELTREKFCSVTINCQSPLRLYRTGDQARWTQDGEIEFLGRIDSQIKIRGFRVELAEIESVLMESSDLKLAAVALREDTAGIQQLVAYLVPKSRDRLDLQSLRTRLRERLPAYMIPRLLEIVPDLPRLPSGKIDRKGLPAPKSGAVESRQELIPPGTDFERTLVHVWQKLFAPLLVSTGDDFFLELGGHSLLAARMVSELRSMSEFKGLSMLDVYSHTTIQRLAAELERRQAPESEPSSPTKSSLPAGTTASNGSVEYTPFWRHFFCGAAQAVSLVFVLTFFALQWLTPYLIYTVLLEEDFTFVEAILGAFASLILFYPVMLMVPILLKWLVIGRYRPGSYPLWGSYYFRFWLVTTIEAAVPVSYLSGTPLLNIYLRLMGAKIGRNVYINSDSFAIYDLLCIDDHSSINAESRMAGYTVENGHLKIGRISVGKRCFVGARAALGPDSVMKDGAALEDLSFLPSHATIPEGETWLGSPALKTFSVAAGVSPAVEGGILPPGPMPESRRSPALRTTDPPGGTPAATLGEAPPSGGFFSNLGFGILHGIGLLLFPVLVVAALFPGIVVMNHLNYIDPYYWYLFLSPLVGASFVLLLALEIAALKWLLLGRIRSRSFPLRSFYYLRKWFVDQTMDLSLDVLGPLYASVYLTPWYKLLGAKLGRGAEISTASFISPDLLSIGEESFIADSVSLGAPRVRDGWMTIGKNHIGRRSFIGNSALLPPDTRIGDNVLIGCLSVPPKDPQDASRENTTWLGSPAINLPERQKNVGFSETATFDPSVKLRIQRAAIEFARVIMPSTLFIILLSLLFSVLLVLHDYFTLTETLLFFPPLYLGCAACATAFTVILKWLLVWRYRPCEKPLWNHFVWRNELLTALHEHLAEPFLVGALTGTPFICWYLRLLGAKIGRRVYLETTDLSEFDLAEIGDEAILNADCTVQTHLFEDRIMKMSTVKIGPHSCVGAGSLVLYDTRMDEGSALGDLSLLMKGEVFPANTRWQGTPARRVRV